jgi:hypothetical protein
MRTTAKSMRIPAYALALCTFVAYDAAAYSLWSTHDSSTDTGDIYLAHDSARLGELRVHGLLLVGPSDWVVPFNNNGSRAPNVCVTRAGAADSPGARVNENVDSCPTALRTGELSIQVVEGGRHQGNQVTTISPTGEVAMSADVLLRFADLPAIRTSFYATSGVTKVPPELRAQAEEVARRLPWMAADAGELRGRIGDFNGNGWVDGTLVAVGTLPAGAAAKAGTQYLLIRHFETDLPVAGVLSGNVKGVGRAVSRR